MSFPLRANPTLYIHLLYFYGSKFPIQALIPFTSKLVYNPFDGKKHGNMLLIINIFLPELGQQFSFFQKGSNDKISGNDQTRQNCRRILIPGPNNKDTTRVPGMSCHSEYAAGVQSAIIGQNAARTIFTNLSDSEKLGQIVLPGTANKKKKGRYHQ